MTKSLFIFSLLISSYFFASAQDVQFYVSVSADTLYFGNPLGIKYVVENAQGDFEPPQFEGYKIIGGPNVSSQFTMINGEVTQSSSYEYIIEPFDVGMSLIPAASLTQGDNVIFTSEVFIYVVENPEGIIQDYRNYDIKKSSPQKLKKEPLSQEDSLRIKLNRIKSKKI